MFHSCAELQGLKFWTSLVWDNSRGKYGFNSKKVREHIVNYPRNTGYNKVAELVRECRVDIYNRWYRQFNKIQKEIIQVTNELQSHQNNEGT